MKLNEILENAYTDSKLKRAIHEKIIIQSQGTQTSDLNISHDNFMQFPLNRVGFRNLEKLTRSTSIYRGNGSTTPLNYKRVDLSDFTFPSHSGVKKSLKEHLAATFTDGFILFKNGTCLYEEYFDGHEDHHRHIMFSTTKSLVGIIAEDYVTRGILDDSLPVTHYLPELGSTIFGDATVRQVMDMTIGYEFTESYADPTSNTAKFGYASGLWQAPEGISHPKNLYDYIKSQEKSGQHDLKFQYVTACTEAMVWIAEKASGESMHITFGKLWEKLGCERDGYFVNDPSGRICSGAGFNATLRDVARFALMVSNNGEWNGNELLSSETVERIFRGGDPSKFALNEDFSFLMPGASYRSQWYIQADHSIMAAGIHGQIIFIHRPSNIVIIKQASHPEAGSILDLDTLAMFEALTSHI